jgi:hypothetical protein
MRSVIRYQAGPLAGVIAFIYLWYLQYKFLGAEGSVQLFTTITDWLHLHGHEKAMRIGVGSMELTASILLLIPRTQVFGAALSFGIITGAIFFHLVSPLGIDPYDDGANLFKEAVTVWFASAGILLIRRRELLAILSHLPVIGRLARALAASGRVQVA